MIPIIFFKIEEGRFEFNRWMQSRENCGGNGCVLIHSRGHATLWQGQDGKLKCARDYKLRPLALLSRFIKTLREVFEELIVE